MVDIDRTWVADRLPDIFDMIEDRRQSGLWHDCYWAKARDLWSKLCAIQPRVILELGSGVTTAIFARYRVRYGGDVYTVDVPEYAQATAQAVEGVHFIHATAEYHAPDCWYSFEMPDVPSVDLLYVDGPDLKGMVGTDAVRVRACVPVRHILFDMRARSVMYFVNSSFGDRYTLKKKGHHTWLLAKSVS